MIRVLHSLSFVEDPTRIIRAARLEARLNFRMEERTEQLVVDALDLLDRVSGDRIRHELYLTLAEAEPERSLARLDELGVLRRLHPLLTCNGWVRERFAALRQALEPPQPDVSEPLSQWPAALQQRDTMRGMYLALLMYRLDSAAITSLLATLRIVREDQRVVQEAHSLRTCEAALSDNDLSPSGIYYLLAEVSDAARLAFSVATDSWLVRQRISQYQRQLRHVQPVLDGSALRRMGIPPGPAYRRLLEALRTAHLDGVITTQEEEEALVRQLSTRGNDAALRDTTATLAAVQIEQD
jgi:tRNA nucleotidyltransferase (CCA-adding enzyme)